MDRWTAWRTGTELKCGESIAEGERERRDPWKSNRLLGLSTWNGLNAVFIASKFTCALSGGCGWMDGCAYVGDLWL